MCKAKSSHVKVSDETGCYSPLFKLHQFVGGVFTAL